MKLGAAGHTDCALFVLRIYKKDNDVCYLK
jgi:hypothetical protein